MDRLELKIKEVIHETAEAATLILENQGGESISYEAGQFLTLVFRRHGHEIRRSYSLSSCPGIDPFVSITIKRKPNGEISRELLDHLGPGDRLVSLPAAGRFTFEPGTASDKQIFLIAAGSGITPIFSLLKKILFSELSTRVVLIYQNHDEYSIIFRRPLQEFASKFPSRFVWVNLLSKPKEKHHTSERLTNFLLEQLVGANFKSHAQMWFYLCGPPAYMRMAQFTLRLMGFTETQIRKENFTVDFIPPAPFMLDKTAKKISLLYHKSRYELWVRYPDSILEAAIKNHIPLPYSCRAGRCASCVARCLRGSIKMSNNEVLMENDLVQGLVLTCVGYAETDLELTI
jgi:ring-1,2-phenylacetyl-CoA epoxidase subunit PaaE